MGSPKSGGSGTISSPAALSPQQAARSVLAGPYVGGRGGRENANAGALVFGGTDMQLLLRQLQQPAAAPAAAPAAPVKKPIAYENTGKKPWALK